MAVNQKLEAVFLVSIVTVCASNYHFSNVIADFVLPLFYHFH